jgi:hypothetical protein
MGRGCPEHPFGGGSPHVFGVAGSCHWCGFNPFDHIVELEHDAEQLNNMVSRLVIGEGPVMLQHRLEPAATRFTEELARRNAKLRATLAGRE